MNGYDLIMSPIEGSVLGEIRSSYISKAKGKVLEIGIGSGANLPYYNRKQLNSFTAIDVKIRSKTKKLSEGRFELVQGSAESLPFGDNSFDTVVATLVLCTVKDADKALSEILRVLKPEGRYIFIEHILPEGKMLAKLFNGINPVWKKVTNGCNLNRNTDKEIAENGFNILNFQKKWKAVGCFGIAEKPKE